VSTLSNDKIALRLNDIIVGRWSQQKFRIVQALGNGGFGTVYLAWDTVSREYKALKISRDMLSLVREFAILKKLNEAGPPTGLVPQVELLDDWMAQGALYGFIVMEYITGNNLRNVLQSRSFTLREVHAMARLLGTLLHILHKLGYAYCDLKPENILYDVQSATFRLVDFGGVRDIGTAVVQFTPSYDRASYGWGLRRADPGYDVFALVVVMIVLATGKEPHHACKEIHMLPRELAHLWKKVRISDYRSMPQFLADCKIAFVSKNNTELGITTAIYGFGALSLVLFLVTMIRLC
jgi:serine/threonine protein kinase, bacterial